MSNDLDEAKKKLLEKLGPNYGVYIQLLGKWFRGVISKEEFDTSAKQLIEQNFVLEHNKFWLAFFHHCANSESSSIRSHNFQLNDAIGKRHNQKIQDYGDNQSGCSPDSTSAATLNFNISSGRKVRCLPNKVITHMKIFVIAWEMGLDSANDNVSLYVSLALQHFLKNIITELLCTKTAYRLRENRFKYAIGVKPMNPYLNNSLKIYSSNLEYDPYQIESNKMNSSLVDVYAYNDSLFPSRLYEAQALYEYACSTTTVISPPPKKHKTSTKLKETSSCENSLNNPIAENDTSDIKEYGEVEDELVKSGEVDEKRLTLLHLLMAFLSNRTIIPSQSLYSINLERIFTKISY